MATLLDLNGPAVDLPPPMPAEDKPSFIGMDRVDMARALLSIGVPERQLKMRVSQIWHWLYVRGVTAFADMTNVAKELRAKLEASFVVGRPEIVAEQVSADGTRKWLMRFPSRGAGKPVEIETVYIPEEGRGTLCVSSQVGCTLTCAFCHTGTQVLVRNLTAEEIVAQVLVARDRLGDYPDAAPNAEAAIPSEGRLVSNVVMMGMGEPLYNFDAVKQALHIIMDGDGLSLSKRRVTLSTSGMVPNIVRAGEEIGSMLAISLHATRDELRDVLVPINKKYPIKELLDACARYAARRPRTTITFEYTMLKGVNDKPEHARQLIKLMRRLPAKVNLIPFNPFHGTRFERSDEDVIRAFQKILLDADVLTMVRRTRGDDIDAACGQLKGQVMDRTRRQAEFQKKIEGGVADAA